MEGVLGTGMEVTGQESSQSTFVRLLGLLSGHHLQKILGGLGVDKYVKKLKTIALIQMIVLAQLKQLGSLRDVTNILNNAGIKQEIGIESISASQVSRRLRGLPVEVAKVMLNAAKLEAAGKIGMNAVTQDLKNLHLIDSSTITLCIKQYGWAKFRSTKSGVKVHLGLRFVDGNALPDRVVITPAKVSDKSQLDILVVEDKDVLNVRDRGYNDYKRYDQECAAGIRFATRLKENAVIDIVEDRPIEPGSSVKRDAKIYLGAPGKNRMTNPLRMIETEDSEGRKILILTNDFHLSARELSDIYRLRWQIELFFKWIKQHLYVKHFYGRTEEAVANQLFIALVAYCLLLLIKLRTGFTGPLLAVLRLVTACICEPFESFVENLLRKPQKSSRGRRKTVDHDAIYQELLRQVIANEADYLNDLTYDPVVL
jgi:IS4 transposase